jgi:hypothetical protein
MAVATATALLVAAGVSAVGAGIGAYSSYQAGKSQEYMAQLNAAQQERNARNQLIAMQTQANLAKREAEANLFLRGIEAQSKENNAKSIENQQIGQDRINRLNLRKRREEFAQFQGQQRAAIAASGISESSGTPLDILAETADTIQQDQEKTFYEQGLQRSTIFREAQLERLGGKLALAGATLDHNSAISAASLQGAAARAEYGANLRAAEITRIGGAYAKNAGMLSAGATLFSGLGSAAGYFAKS